MDTSPPICISHVVSFVKSEAKFSKVLNNCKIFKKRELSSFSLRFSMACFDLQMRCGDKFS